MSSSASESEGRRDPRKRARPSKEPAPAADPADPSDPAEPLSDGEGGRYFTLSANRRISLRPWKGKMLIDIREYYTDAVGEEKPGKKGISLSEEQFDTLKALLPAIERELEAKRGKK